MIKIKTKSILKNNYSLLSYYVSLKVLYILGFSSPDEIIVDYSK